MEEQIGNGTERGEVHTLKEQLRKRERAAEPEQKRGVESKNVRDSRQNRRGNKGGMGGGGVFD